VWTYGYNADVIGVFQANNKNSVSQHGRDLAVKLEREIENGVTICCVLVCGRKLKISGPDHICGTQPRRHYR
jgi:hypothetical protein